MRPFIFILLATAILIIPIALLAGGHNGLTVTGVILAIIAIVSTIIHTPSRKERK